MNIGYRAIPPSRQLFVESLPIGIGDSRYASLYMVIQ